MKIIVALVLSASLMACGGKSKQNATPTSTTGTTDTTTAPDGTGGTTYGGATTTPAPGTEPGAAQ